MSFSLRDIGYTIYSRYEDALRNWLQDRLLALFGDQWKEQVPSGIRNKITDRLSLATLDLLPISKALAQTDLPDLMEIVCHKGSFTTFLPEGHAEAETFRKHVVTIYQYRNKIAHVDPQFTKADLLHLVGLADEHLVFLDQFGADLRSAIKRLDDPANLDIIHVPIGLAGEGDAPNNLPGADFELEGGFIGRGEELSKLKRYLLRNLDRVVTITGAGGVGKTALALRLCQSLLRTKPFPFDAIVWTSAKEEKLGLTGIESIEPTLGSFEDLIDSILSTLDWHNDLDKSLNERLESIEAILNAGDRGILIVVDNLETVQDERILDFIRELPPPNKALLTSRIGLGEIERRCPLGALNAKEAVLLFRMIGRDKGLSDLAILPENVVSAYTDRLHRYPLAIKWALGQVSLGKDINSVIVDSASATGDIARFCFDHIFANFVPRDEKLVLYALSSQDQPLSKGVLSHLAELPVDVVEMAIQNLLRASLIIPQHKVDQSGAIATSYELLGLTKSYAYSKLQSEKDVLDKIHRRMAQVKVTIDEGARAKRQYKYTFRDMDASTEEEKIAATWCLSGYQKFQSGDYASAVQMFQSAVKIAPGMSTAYRNWARMEIEAGFYVRAKELIKKAVELTPGVAGMWREWASIEMKAQNYAEAAEKVNRALQLEPEDPQLLNLLAEIEKRRGNQATADSLFRQALEGMRGRGDSNHEMIVRTAMADNLRKWAEDSTLEPEMQRAKLVEAYELIQQVTAGDTSPRAQATFREITFALGLSYEESRNEMDATRLYDSAISWQPIRDSDKARTVHAATYIADRLVRQGDLTSARKYLDLALAYCRPPAHQIHALELEYSQERKQGKLTNVARDRGFGFLSYDKGARIFLHFRNVTPPCTSAEFESSEGLDFSFLIGKNGDRHTAVRAIVLREGG